MPIESLPEPLPERARLRRRPREFGGAVPVAGDRRRPAGRALRPGLPRAPGSARTPTAPAASCCSTPAPTPPPTEEGLLTTVAWGVDGRVDYALEAAIFVTGAAVQWLRDGLGIIRNAAETEELARSLDSNDGVYLVPAFTGLGSPHWDPYARGTIVGLTRGTGRAHLARATLEAIAYQTVDAVRAMEAASGDRLAELKADGGAVHNSWLMQFQADVLGVPVVVPEVSETTALGAALSRRRRDRAPGARRTCARCGARPPATSRGWRRTSATSCSRAGAARSTARADGPARDQTRPDRGS